jgi:hypothetical protein
MKRLLLFSNKTLFVLLLIFIINSLSCSNESYRTNLRIEKSKDTLKIDEPITVRFYLDNFNELKQPNFHIIGAYDTLMLPFDDKLNCGIFKGHYSKTGEKKYYGFVEFMNKKGNLNRENFEFSFLVIKPE